MVAVEGAEEGRQIDDVRRLFCAFVAWHRATHVEDIALIDHYFDQQAFDAELSALPGSYAPPQGALLIAYSKDGIPAGCVAMHDLGGRICEMKRMFVAPAFQRRGIGRLLAERIIAAARDAGYRRMRLDTSRRQKAAISLYKRLGFQQVPPSCELPEDMAEWLVFFELAL